MNKTLLFSICFGLFLLWLASDVLGVCSVAGDCQCQWTATGSTNYFIPNGTNQSFTCQVQCVDTDGSCLSMGTTCQISIQKSISGAGTTLDTGPTDGTSAIPQFCGGQSCISPNIRAYLYTFTRNISTVRSNLTRDYTFLRCYSSLPTATGSLGGATWMKQYISSPGNPNVSVSWFDETTNKGGTNESARIGGNRTCWNITPTTDGKIVNVSLWANFSTNGTNSTTFRLIDKEQWTNLSNATMTFCRNITNALDGAMSWNNVSWAVCANSNTTTGAVTRYGMSCTSKRGPSPWITSGTSMSTANSVETFNWFNITWPNAPPPTANPCIPTPGTWWNVTTNITCIYDDSNKSINVSGLNITERGSLKSSGMNLSDTGQFAVTGSTDEVQSVTIFRNGNLTIADNLTFDTTVIWSNLSVALNYSEGGTRRFNITKDGDLRIVNHTNATSLDGNPFWFDAEWGSNLTLWASDLNAYAVLESQGYNITNSTLYYVRLHANNTQFGNVNLTRGFDLYAEDQSSPIFNTTVTNISTRQCGIIGLNITGTYLNCTNDATIAAGTALSVTGGTINLSWFVANSSEATQGIGLQVQAENSSFEDFEVHGYYVALYIFTDIWANTNLNFTRFNISNKPVQDDGSGCMEFVDPPGPPPPMWIKVRYLIRTDVDSRYRDGTFDGYCGADDLSSTGVAVYTNVSLLTTMLDTVAASPSNYRVDWLLNVYVNDTTTTAAIPTADVRVFDGADLNSTTSTDATGYAHVNLTQQFLGDASTYTLLTFNVSKTGYRNRTLTYDFAFNGTDTEVGRAVTYPFVNLTGWCVPQNVSWTVPVSQNCTFRHQPIQLTSPLVFDDGPGWVTFEDTNITATAQTIPPSPYDRLITIRAGSSWHIEA